jgi:membrane protein
MSWLHRKLLKFKPYDYFIEWTKIIILPGFGSLPLYTVATFFFQEIAREALLNKASSLSYNFLLAIFPGIIFLFTLIPYIPVENFQGQLLSFISLVLPVDAYNTIQSTLEDIVTKQNSGLLSFGFLAALIFATNGIHSLMLAFNKSSLVAESRSWLKQRVVAVFLSMMVVIALTIGMTILTVSGYVFSYLKDDLGLLVGYWIPIATITRWIILIGIYFFTVSFLYKYGPSVSKKWKLFSPGATLATILAILTMWGFAYYINHFNTYNKLYGSIGTLIVIMVWLYLNSLILLIGFELNASIALSKQSIKIIKPRFNSFRSAEERVKKID